VKLIAYKDGAVSSLMPQNEAYTTSTNFKMNQPNPLAVKNKN